MCARVHEASAAACLALLGALALGNAGCVAAVRVYDPLYGDYHYWNGDEEASFRVFLNERHEPYRDFRHLDRDRQQAYWKWHHERHE